MKTIFLVSVLFTSLTFAFAQTQPRNAQLLKELSENTCKCVDSIALTSVSESEIVKAINKCLSSAAEAYQLGCKLSAVADKADTGKKGKKSKQKINISLNTNPNSGEYQEYYFEVERYMMDSCRALKNAVKTDNASSDHSTSKIKQAKELYEMGNAESTAGNYTDAIEHYKAALRVDSIFSFAWDNLGIAYRKTEQYDLALAAYRRSIEVTPSGKVPRQNIAIVYEYKKEYQKAIDAYEDLASMDKSDPEVYYGIGRMYTVLGEWEKGLDNICTAYSLYVKQRSPYRSDAEKLIGGILGEMKKHGKEKRFYEILKEHNISSE